MAEYRPDSLYRNTDIIGSKYLDDLNVDNIDLVNTTTKSVKIELRHNEKPDLLAHDLYGRKELWWVFAQRNPDEIEDPIYDFAPGVTIQLPKLSNLKTDLGI